MSSMWSASLSRSLSVARWVFQDGRIIQRKTFWTRPAQRSRLSAKTSFLCKNKGGPIGEFGVVGVGADAVLCHNTKIRSRIGVAQTCPRSKLLKIYSH